MGANTPVMQATITVGGLLALFKAFILLAKAMGWFSLNEVQEKAWLDFIEIAFPIAVAVGTGWWLSRNTTSLHQPTDIDGVRLSRPDGSEAIKEREKSDDRAILEGRSIKR